jgi:histidinol-phosphate/aromatic aminotransferase/cobyric acid decarboxylase-like protein
MKLKIFKRIRKESPNPNTSIRLHRAEFGHNFREKIKANCYYPDTDKVINFISNLVKISPKNIIVGLGAESIIKDIFIYLNSIKKKNFFFFKPTFGLYEYYSKLFKFKIYNKELYPGKKFPIKQLKIIIKKKNIDALVIVNPSHPVENFYSEKELISLGNFCKKKKIILILDEVYNSNFLLKKRKILNLKNVIIINSFSKIFGLPGLRLGYAAGNINIIRQIENFRLAIELSENTVKFSENLKNLKLLKRNMNKIKLAKKFASINFKKRNIKFYNNYNNSITFDALNKKNANKIYNFLIMHNIYSLKLSGKSLNRFINVATTNKKNLSFFFKAIDRFNNNKNEIKFYSKLKT